MSGAGNDFVIIDKLLNPGIVLSNSVINRLCDRRNGIGADGVILFEDAEKYDFSMVYYNSDGSTGSLCANGARCAMKFAKKTGRNQRKTTSFLSNGIEYSGELLSDGLLKFNLNNPGEVKQNINLKVLGKDVQVSFADTGSPHVIIDLNEIDSDFYDEMDIDLGLANFAVDKIGKEIRNDKNFSPGGTNVNFIEVKEDEIHIRTYERGVESETLACGTGAVAGAIIGSIKYGIVPPISMVTKGGEILKVNFELNGPEIKNVSLIGPASEIFSGEILIN